MDLINTEMRKATYIKHLEGITLSFESRLSITFFLTCTFCHMDNKLI